MSTQLEWAVRGALEGDLPFIYSTWYKTFRYGSQLGRACECHTLFTDYTKVIDYLLFTSDVTVATVKDEPSVILSYVVYDASTIHYAFTKEAFRKNGILKSMIDLHEPRMISHKTFMIENLLPYFKNLKFNPFLLFKQKEDTDG